MKKGTKALIIIGCILAAIGIFILVMLYLESDFYEESKALRKEKLSKFRYSSGGDMQGSRYAEVISRLDEERAVLTVSNADWHAADNTVNEYLIDAKVLDEIEKVFRKYHMRGWTHRRISGMFVADGASYSYSFTFGGTEMSFSSQVYMGRYRRGTDRIKDIIYRYSENAERIPGLVVSEKTEEEEWQAGKPTEGVFRFEVYEYSEGYLYCRFLNGLSEGVTVSREFTLKNAETGEEIPVTNSKYHMERQISPNDTYQSGTQVNGLLPEGRYILESGEYAAEFEIK